MTPFSSAPAQPGDWRQIMDLCFNNREADLGGFVRRHLLSSELPNVLAETRHAYGSGQ